MCMCIITHCIIYCILTLVFHYRVRREHIWKKAVEWIATSDSRVRVESQMIAGEQFDVWKWIHLDPPATEVKYHASLITMYFV